MTSKPASRMLAFALTAGLTMAANSAPAQIPAKEAVDKALTAAQTKYKGLKEGKNADYIPALAKVDPNVFGIALVTVDGQVYTVGDVTTQVSIQSISKVFTMAKVMEESGADAIRDNMGVDATGQVFNSIVAVEQYKGARDERDGEPGRDHRDQHGEGRDRTTRSGRRSSATTATSPAARSR